jgi:peptide/nickel transport system permease protein
VIVQATLVLATATIEVAAAELLRARRAQPDRRRVGRMLVKSQDRLETDPQLRCCRACSSR